MTADRPGVGGRASPPAADADHVPAAVPGIGARLVRVGGGRGARLASQLESSLSVRCLRRFVAVNGRDRALVLGGQAFTTIIPLLIVVAASASQHGPTTLADRLAVRFHVTGTSADAIRELFERPPGATGTVTIAGSLVLLLSLLSLTRSLQRLYEATWNLPSAGVRGTLNGVTALGLLLTSLLVLSLLTGLLREAPAGSVWAFLMRIAGYTAVWLLLQRLLLSRRIPVRRLLPGAVFAGVGSVAMNLYSAVWMPRVIESNAERYGIIGITFAMLTWLIVVGFCVVVVAVIGFEMGGSADGGPRAAHPLQTSRADGLRRDTVRGRAPRRDFITDDFITDARGGAMSASVPYTPDPYPAETYPSNTVGRPEQPGGVDSAGKLAWWLALAASLFGLTVGIMMVAWPEATLKVVAVLFGAWLLVHGLVRIAQAITGRADEDGAQRAIMAVVGVFYVAVGIVALRNLLASLAVIVTLIGLMWLIGGIVEVVSAFGGPGGGFRWWRIVLGALSIIAAVVVLVWPDLSLITLVYVTGAWFIVMGLLQVAMVLWARRELHAAPGGDQVAPALMPGG
ncbi:MAG TPA: HdeD family acid-resistance protein [Actinoplanes sp.]|jgi:membrane protein